MNNSELYRDYLKRSKGRLKALDVLYGEELWADVVRESQEVVELALKGLLRYLNIDVPRIHDVGSVFEVNQNLLPDLVKKALPDIVEISRELRRDRELAFYGSEDITPQDFYREKHAKIARQSAVKIVELCLRCADLQVS